MSVSGSLRRLLQLRALEEELRRAALEKAVSDLRLLEAALEAARQRERNGRRHVMASAGSADVADRIAGLEETRAANLQAAALRPRIAEMELEVGLRRREFLAKRTERRQAETLIRKAESAVALVAGRRAQRELDEWFLRREGRGGGPLKKN